MTRDWKQWEGQTVNGNFPLRQYLGGSENSAVFFTERRGQEPQRAAIKLVVANPATVEVQLARWEASPANFPIPICFGSLRPEAANWIKWFCFTW